MMGRHGGNQSRLLYLFNLEERIPERRPINPVVTRVLDELRSKLKLFYSEISRDWVNAYVAELRAFGNSGYSILSRLQELYDAARVMNPNANWSWIRDIASRVRRTTKPARDKRPRMVSSADLVNLGTKLMEQADLATTSRLGAILFRDGLMIALVALRPVRLKNTALIELNRHVRKHGDIWRLRFGPDEVKNNQGLDMPWPDELTQPLELG
jgi:integrase/recombinase XerD